VLGRASCLPALLVPLAARGNLRLGVLSCDSFFDGQALADASDRMDGYKERWKPFLGFDDEAIMAVHVWRVPGARLPPVRDPNEPATPPKGTRGGRKEEEVPQVRRRSERLLRDTRANPLPHRTSRPPPRSRARPR
jgi:hypothetical protein